MRKIFKKSKKGIKICRILYDIWLTSCYENMNRVTYKKHRWAKRPKNCGALAVFDTVENAKRFLHIDGITTIQYDGQRVFFTCKYKPSKDVMWNYGKPSFGKMHRLDNVCYIPKGTMYADKVKILKEVKYNE